jgi:sulfonate transport system permease protein
VFLAIWELMPALGIVPAQILPPPSALPRAFEREFS